MTIGISGTGKMGTAMGLRLIEKKQKLAVWNRTQSRTRDLVKAGATKAKTPAELVEASETVINMVIDDKAAKAVYEGRDGLLSGPVKGKTIIEMSTLMPDTIKDLAKKVAAKGGTFVECPVGGSVAPARQGALIGMVGSTPAAYKKAKPVLEHLCRRIDRVGTPGAGAAMKLAINLPLVVYFEALGEALALTEKAGIDRKLAGEIMADSNGAAKVAGARMSWVVDAIGGKMPKDVGFAISGAKKDATLMAKLSSEFGVDAPVINATKRAYTSADKEGWGNRDLSMLSAWRVAEGKKRKKPAAKKAAARKTAAK